MRRRALQVAARAVEARLNAEHTDRTRVCACGQPLPCAGRRVKTFERVLGPVRLARAYSHCATCGAGCCPRDRALSRPWARLRHDELDAGHLRALCAALRQHASTHSEARRCWGYVTQHRARLRYPTFRAQGLCVSSGVVEAGCKVAIGTRLERTGMHWTVADAIALRRCRLSGRFEDFWERRAARREAA